ncbi:MauE/DoxX family redox-associated membrane protein [Geoalkalibacter subterraneus]|uniref:Methylamine utilisation protein MauE domain-containing protein n=1 Tax=Geoalkalibacter subterraneus TaxID=483547 RepID=A0A0B5FQ84_9BACT|nr:MauE/DoxX family redox-associated membrane protein [Geoalkalibacter subterraneus]AJF06245.1 hypothetical protein GSUB_06315 [Geoalkalibacter subterraneus]
MMRSGVGRWLYRLARWGLGAVFIYAGALKISEPEVFAVLIGAYGLLPEFLLLPMAVFLASLEIVAGFGLLFDLRGSLAAVTGMLLLFIAVLSYGLWMGLDVDCGCFGPDDPEAEAFHGLKTSLYRDLVMMVGVVFIYGWRRFAGIVPVSIGAVILTKRRKSR